MTDPSPAVQMPEWVLWIGGMIGTAAAVVIAKLGSVAGAKEKQSTDKVGMIAALQPSPQLTPQRYAEDALVQTLAKLILLLERIEERMEAQDKEKEEDEKAELRELRRFKEEMDRSAGDHTRSPRR